MVSVSFPYSFRIVSASGSENDRTTKEGGKKEERRTIRKPCGIDTETIGGTREEEGRKEGQDKPFRLVPLTRFQMEA